MSRVPCVWTLIGVAAFLFVQCATAPAKTPAETAAQLAGTTAFATVYEVLQHPRCKNCHPAGAAPLQGDDSRPHGQNVMGGPDGKGLYAMRCVNCHSGANTPGTNMPPGAANWHLPHPSMPLVFEGRTAAQLARQLADPQQNGGKTMEQLLHHVAADPLVLWGWNPGDGRAPVPVPHATFQAAMQAWIDGGCPVPE